MKTCTICHKRKPLSAFYQSNWNRTHKRRVGDGYRQPCKPCALNMEVGRREKWSADQLAEWKKSRGAKARRWDARHPHNARARHANTQSRRRGANGVVTEADVRQVWERWQGRCWVCGYPATEVDHFIPVNKQAGGTNTADNIRPVCADCNHKRDWKWYGEEKAMKEASMLREIKRMLLS